MTASPAIDVALAELKRALREDLTQQHRQFVVDGLGRVSPRALHALSVLEALLAAGACPGRESVAGVVNDALERLQELYHVFKRQQQEDHGGQHHGQQHGGGTGQHEDVVLYGRVSQFMRWLRRERRPSDGGGSSTMGAGGGEVEGLSLAASMAVALDEEWHHSMARYGVMWWWGFDVCEFFSKGV